MVTRVTYTQTDTHTVTYPSLVTLSQSIPQGRGSHSGLCASSLIGAFPSRIPSRVNLAACRITDIARGCSPPKSKSPGSRSTVIETAATSGSGGTQRSGSDGPSPNAASGCRLPNRRIQRSVALSETCTRHEPPSYSPITHTVGQSVSQQLSCEWKGWSTHGHGPAERGGDAKREEVPRGVIQSLHGQRAVRRHLGRFFLPGRLADVVGVRLSLLHVAPAERLHERVELQHQPPTRTSVHSLRNKKNPPENGGEG